MKLSELKKKLTEIEKEFGDLEVVVTEKDKYGTWRRNLKVEIRDYKNEKEIGF